MPIKRKSPAQRNRGRVTTTAPVSQSADDMMSERSRPLPAAVAQEQAIQRIPSPPPNLDATQLIWWCLHNPHNGVVTIETEMLHRMIAACQQFQFGKDATDVLVVNRLADLKRLCHATIAIRRELDETEETERAILAKAGVVGKRPTPQPVLHGPAGPGPGPVLPPATDVEPKYETQRVEVVF
jgi:hypothetical protein